MYIAIKTLNKSSEFSNEALKNLTIVIYFEPGSGHLAAKGYIVYLVSNIKNEQCVTKKKKKSA